MIKKEQITRVYSGKVGCACGCRGNYSTNKAVITKAYSDYLRVISKTPLEEAEGMDGEHFVFWENSTGSRTYTIYFKKEGAK